MAEDKILKINSKSGKKEYFNIVLYNNLSDEYINRSLLTQEVEYRVDGVDDDPWKVFRSEYNSYTNRKTVFGYYVEIKNYNTFTDINNTATDINEDSLKVNSKFTISTDTQYDATGYIFMPGLFGIEINELDDMTANELLGKINDLTAQLNELTNKVNNDCVNVNQINLYATMSWVDERPTSYVTYAYLDQRLENVPSGGSSQDLSQYALKTDIPSLDGYATENWVSSCSYITETDLNEALSDFTPGEGGNIDLTDYATIEYVDGKVREAEISGGMYDDTEIREDVDNLTDRLDKYIAGPYAYLKSENIEYGSLTVEDISTLFTINDLFQYTFKQPYLENSSYTPALWTYFGESPFPSWTNGKTVTFKENKDIKDFIYKINVTSSNNYNEDIYLTQKATERIYFLDGNSLALENYNQRTINLSNYIITNFEGPTVDVDWININSHTSIFVEANSQSTESRTGILTFRDSSNNAQSFTITQPGNPDYDPNSGSGGDTPGGDGVEVEREWTASELGFSDTQEVTDVDGWGISIKFAKGTGSNPPKYYNSGSSIRCYRYNTITITVSDTLVITKIEFLVSSTTNNGMLICNMSGFDETIPQNGFSGSQIWEGETSEIQFTVDSSENRAGQYRISGIKVTVIE